MTKAQVLRTMPWTLGFFTARNWTREDIDIRAEWPDYPVNYEAFNSTIRTQDADERACRFREWDADENQLNLSVDFAQEKNVGHFRLWEIDWDRMIVGGMGVRLHPHYCDRGYGTFLVRSITSRLSGLGFTAFSLDVSQGNPRAFSAYRKVGFRKTTERTIRGHVFDILELDSEMARNAVPEVAMRGASPADAELLASVVQRASHDVARNFGLTLSNCPTHPSNCVPEWIEKDMRNGKKYLILETEKPIGVVAIEKADDNAVYIGRLSVLPAGRNLGFGRRLLAAAEKEAREWGCTRVEIGIIASHSQLKNWHSKSGYTDKATAEFPHLPFNVAFMQKSLV